MRLFISYLWVQLATVVALVAGNGVERDAQDSLTSRKLAGPFEKRAPDGSITRVVKRAGATVTIFEHALTGSTLEFVTDSGLCEKTPNVKQYSGYLSVGENMNMWFWFFEARKNPEKAPLAAWFNGGPGCSSMIGLFQENGPCTYNNGEPAGSPSHNPYSFNEYANMMYIDQPVGVGFSMGNMNIIDSTMAAAKPIWNLIQAFYVLFPQYKSREFGIWTESYGGHYGPGFAKHILDQNAAIDKGTLKGQKVNMVALGVNNGWINPYDNYKGQIDFSLNNTYKRLISPAQAKTYHNKLETQCLPALKRCWQNNNNQLCSRAMTTCKLGIESPLISAGDYDVYDIRKAKRGKWPPQTYEGWLHQPAVQQMIGAKKRFDECPRRIQSKFLSTGDDSKNFTPLLEEVIAKNVTTLIWAGDSDWICNWMANLYTANDVKYSGQAEFRLKPMASYKVNGKDKGQYKAAKNLSFLRVYNAGHTVMAYRK